ncbi:P-loop containing nucleoside triphosphate hydrolase protein [Chlamydoabsidia padenii]|nr:P-loop containing nucleoside triphosphate hydrolase protein [Chlamydoabsidia padenii]
MRRSHLTICILYSKYRFYTHGINQLQSLAQLSVQDYAQLGITDITDRRKIFTLIQLLRKEPTPRLNTVATTLTPSTSAIASGIRRPQSYGGGTSRLSVNTTNIGSSGTTNGIEGPTVAPPSSPLHNSRSAQNNNNHTTTTTTTTPLELYNTSGSKSSRLLRPRPLSIVGDIPIANKSTLPIPSNTGKLNRTIRQRTMSDAGRLDMSCLPARSTKDHRQRTNLRHSLYLDQDDSIKSMLSGFKNGKEDDNISSSDDDDSTSRQYRTAAPLLNAYGTPTVKTRASMGALKYLSTKSPSTCTTPPVSTSTAAISSQSYNLPPSDLDQKIRVCVRKRPLNKKEVDKGEKDISPCIGTRSLHINEPKLRLDMSRYIEQHSFTFDDVFDLDTPNFNVYERTALPLVKYIFEGGKATCFAYGQTGSGKTFTMLDTKHGLYIMAANDIFSLLRRPENQHLSAWIGLYEIYQGQLYDLLNNRKKLFAREDGKQNVVISGLKEYPIDNVDKLIQVFDYGNQVRTTGSTGANDSSSRSHAILQVLLKPKKNKKKIHGKLSFIDLAGSERGADRGDADTKTRMEGAEINKSLLALKECIRALDLDKRHTPFRQSKLTQVLKDSFVGNSRTCMIATISPGGTNSEHTLNTLRYADRVKELKGERDRRFTIECSRSGRSGELGGDRTNHLINNGENDEGDSHDNDSDILDEDTYNLGEENIFDVDFPHEEDELIRSNTFNTKKPIPQPATSSASYTQTARQDSNEQKQYPSQPMIPTNDNSRIKLMTRSSSGLLPLTDSPHTMHRSSSLTMDSNTPKKKNLSVTTSTSIARSIHSDRTTRRENVIPLEYNDMDDFIKLHRAEIRTVAEYTKQESKLLASITLQLSSNQGDDGRINHQFRSFLESLDETLEEKMESIAALRDRINDTMVQMDG